jgi:propionate catabolism operon transcriptional regulator
LITGESGTGKELFAQSIHNASKRKNAPFVAINCATLPESILESELFGYADASFTGAKKGGKTGLFQQAHMGTIFLDEIGELPISVQSKLLRVLQEKQIRPVGDDKIIPIDVRIISATNKNLFEDVDLGKFRLDLLYRINVLNLKIPPLRERPADIKAIAYSYFSKNYPQIYMKHENLINNILEDLKTYYFPGNVRELENILERLFLMLNSNLNYEGFKKIMHSLLDRGFLDLNNIVKDINLSEIEINEKQNLMEILVKNNNSRSRASKELGISLTTLWRRMKKYGII